MAAERATPDKQDTGVSAQGDVEAAGDEVVALEKTRSDEGLPDAETDTASETSEEDRADDPAGDDASDTVPDADEAHHADKEPYADEAPDTDEAAAETDEAEAKDVAETAAETDDAEAEAKDVAGAEVEADGTEAQGKDGADAEVEGVAEASKSRLDAAPGGAPGAAGLTPDEARKPVPESIPLLGIGARAWKQVTFELLNLPLAIAGFVSMVVLLTLGSGLAITITGLPLLAVGLIICRMWGQVDRARARSLLGLDIPTPSKVPVRNSGFFGWLWAQLSDPVGWRAALYLLIRLPWGVVSFSVTLTVLVGLWPVAPYVVYGFAAVDRALMSALLSPSSAMERRIRELEAGRETMVDAAAADRRRIERDLHDGAQARLVALAMDLGLAKERMNEDPATAARMVEQAHGEVKVALEELRNLARGIHPAILTERGLGAALSNVAGRCIVPVTVNVDLPSRPSGAVEGLLYFTTAELLTNISKHSGATNADVRLAQRGRTIELTVTDDGRGGASATSGGGLAGLTERVRAMDGTFTLTSPPGGPTVVEVRLPQQDQVMAVTQPGTPARSEREVKRDLRQASRELKESMRTDRPSS
ncbi:sensor histidine kinase [Pseudofrankia inefficax]|uniref:histidine kinase n=1 Tax=Pseudofrankia inefficax (strain DSM 45817 / CECT 9037 / DDB 130130 / EuI1c) TaxID=298654 RepID=E3JB46_PSEI1|nr:sensor domain-containing protein [Pseudofrankia inefficax]ADP84667.1 integral membrane sensor signal transduction histidine kinase [Pseudofrankia inefficax]